MDRYWFYLKIRIVIINHEILCEHYIVSGYIMLAGCSYLWVNDVLGFLIVFMPSSPAPTVCNIFLLNLTWCNIVMLMCSIIISIDKQDSWPYDHECL